MSTFKHPISQRQLNEIKSSRVVAMKFFTQLRIPGWPKVITTQPGHHFLVP